MMDKLLIMTLLIGFSISAHADINPWKESFRLEEAFQYDAAIAALSSVDAGNELAKLRRGWLNYLKGSHSASIEHYKKAIQSNSDSLDGRLGLLLPLLAQQRWREAALNAEKVLEIAPWNYHAHVRLMLTEEAVKQWSKLSAHALAVHHHYPSDATVLVYLARASHKLGDKAAANKYYIKVLELIPDHIEAKQYID